MSIAELFLIAFGLSMDAFAVAVCNGVSMGKAPLKNALTVGIYFGVFQALMPLLGYLLGTQFSKRIMAFDHWITFALLAVIGGRMVIESFRKEDNGIPVCTTASCLAEQKKAVSFGKMLPLAIATSIDALAVGISFAFLQVNILPAVVLIGLVTLVLSAVGVKIGGVFGAKFKTRAEFAGGMILVLLGGKILLEHLDMLPF